MRKKIKKLLERMFGLSDKEVEKQYEKVINSVGDALNHYSRTLKHVKGFKRLLAKWVLWEKEYARCGYQTLSITAIINYWGFWREIEKLGVKREKGDNPILYAEIYKQRFFWGSDGSLISNSLETG